MIIQPSLRSRGTGATVCAFAITFLLGLALPQPEARAALIAYDSFNTYPTGDLSGNNGGEGWTTAWASFTAANDVVAGGLSYSSGGVIIEGGANSMQKTGTAGGANADPYLNRSFTSTSSTEVWMSFLLRSTNLSGTDFLEFYLSDATGENFSGAALINFGATGGDKVGARANPSLAANSVSAYNGGISANTTYFLVLRVSGDGEASATNYDRVELWVNPSSTTLGASTVSVDLDMGINSLSYFGLRAANLANSDVFGFDELRIGTTTLDVVVPEPAPASILAVGVLSLSLYRRRRAGLVR